MQRLTAADRLMLMTDAAWPQDVAAIVVIEAAPLLDAAGEVRIEAVRQHIAGRLHLLPRFRQLLVVPPLGLGPPVWVDAPRVDLADHVRVAAVPAPGGNDELLATVERLRVHRLDRARPLWEIWVLTGLPNRELALFARLHHVMVDGMAGVAALGVLFDPAADTPSTPPRPWTPAPPPTRRQLAVENIVRWTRALRAVVTAVRSGRTTVDRVREAWPEARDYLVDARGAGTSLNRRAGTRRRVAVLDEDLGAVLAAAHAHGASLNDVLLTVTAGGLRRLLAARGEDVEDLVVRMHVPVSLRPPGTTSAEGNALAQMLVPVPVGVPDACRRLERVAAETTARKRRQRAPVGAPVANRLVGRVLVRLMVRRPVNVTVVDLRGSAHPLYLAGARVQRVVPLPPLLANVTVGVGALSYAGRLTVAVVADADLYPDLELVVSGLREDLHDLITPRPTVGVAAADGVRARVRRALTDAMTARDAAAVAALRSALGTLDNAAAVPTRPVTGTRLAVEHTAVGAGVTDVPRRQPPDEEAVVLLQREIRDLETAAARYEAAGRPERAAELRAGAAVLRRVVVP